MSRRTAWTSWTSRTPRIPRCPQIARGLALAGLGLVLSCTDGRPLVLVDVGPLPAQPARLRVSLSYDGQPARLPSPIWFDLHAHKAGDTASFGVHLPASTNGDLVIGVGVLDEAGCLAALGSTSAAPVLSQPRVALALQTPPADVPTEARCSDPEKTPLLLRVTPDVVASRGDEARLQIFGWGFVPSGADCPIVTIDGNTAPNVLCPSFAELSVDLPPGPGRIGRVPIRVLNRTNGRATTRRDLFGYYAKDIVLSTATGGPVLLPSAVSGLASADLNRDGRADLVAISRSKSSIHVLFHDGSGDGSDAFPPAGQVSIAVGVRPSNVAIGDLSGDGLPDLAVSNPGDGTVSLLMQEAALPGQPFVVAKHSRVYANLEPDSLTLFSANRDGLLDLAVANRLSSDVSVFINSGLGAFDRMGQRDYDVGRQPSSLVAADFTGDGQVDLLCGDGSPQTFSLLAHSGDRDFVLQPVQSPTGSRPLQIAVADVDGDGRSDLLRLLAGGLIELWRNAAEGPLRQSEIFRAPIELTRFAVTDLDLDGRPDIVALAGSTASLYVLRNPTRQGSVDRPFTLVSTLSVGPASSAPVAVVASDFDGDGLPDVAVARSGDNSIAFWNNRSL